MKKDGATTMNDNIFTNGQLDYLARKIAKYVVELIPEQEAKKFLTKEQVASLLGKSTEAIDKMCNRGKIPFHTKGKHRYFSIKELNDYFLNE